MQDAMSLSKFTGYHRPSLDRTTLFFCLPPFQICWNCVTNQFHFSFSPSLNQRTRLGLRWLWNIVSDQLLEEDKSPALPASSVCCSKVATRMFWILGANSSGNKGIQNSTSKEGRWCPHYRRMALIGGGRSWSWRSSATVVHSGDLR